jgi:hypothetical protein
MDESTCFGVLLLGDIRSDAVLGLSWDEISRYLGTCLGGRVVCFSVLDDAVRRIRIFHVVAGYSQIWGRFGQR